MTSPRRLPPGVTYLTEDDVSLLRSLSELGEDGVVKREYMAGRSLDLSASLASLAERIERYVLLGRFTDAPSPSPER